MEMVGKLDSGMDEVLVSSIIEACVRVEKPALLKDYLANRVRRASPDGGSWGKTNRKVNHFLQCHHEN